MMTEYIVDIEINGIWQTVGTLHSKNGNDGQFQYSDTYLALQEARPISLSLPLQDAPFSAAETKKYFEGLLPEGFTRRSVAQWLHASEDDYLSLLHGLGRECIGAGFPGRII